jgi:putative transposase
MPKNKLVYTHQFPYHVVARCNNKEWFKIDINIVWNIFCLVLNDLSKKYGFCVHAFALMSNHYHLLVSTSEKFKLGYVMNMLQKKVAQQINCKSKRINHVFGGTYRGTLITQEYYYVNVIKYVFRNPLEAGICDSVLDYKYSTLLNYMGKLNQSCLHLISSTHVMDSVARYQKKIVLEWLNYSFSSDDYELIKKGLNKSEFKICSKSSQNAQRRY